MNNAIGTIRTVTRKDDDGNEIEIRYEVERVRFVDQSFQGAYYALSGYSISNIERPNDALYPTWEGFPIQERIYVATREKSAIILEASRCEITLDPEDITGAPGGFLIDGMPWDQWLDAMTMD